MIYCHPKQNVLLLPMSSPWLALVLIGFFCGPILVHWHNEKRPSPPLLFALFIFHGISELCRFIGGRRLYRECFSYPCFCSCEFSNVRSWKHKPEGSWQKPETARVRAGTSNWQWLLSFYPWATWCSRKEFISPRLSCFPFFLGNSQRMPIETGLFLCSVLCKDTSRQRKVLHVF